MYPKWGFQILKSVSAIVVAAILAFIGPIIVLTYLGEPIISSYLSLLWTCAQAAIWYFLFQFINLDYRLKRGKYLPVLTFLLIACPCVLWFFIAGPFVPSQLITALLMGYFLYLEKASRTYQQISRKTIICTSIRILILALIVSGQMLVLSLSAMQFSVDNGIAILYYILLVSTYLPAMLVLKLLPNRFIIGLNRHNNASIQVRWNSKQALALAVSVIFMLSSTAFAYWDQFSLNNPSQAREYAIDEVFSSHTFTGTPAQSRMNKSDLIDYLHEPVNQGVDTSAILSLLTRNRTYAEMFIQTLLAEADARHYLGIQGSVKAWQYDMMVRIYYFVKVTSAFPALLNESETQVLLDWFRDVNRDAYALSMADLYYGLAFKKVPDGIYENQEIGVGMLSAFSKALENQTPDLVKQDLAYIASNGVGWNGNFRNPDDGAVYHQTVWIQNAYLMALWGGQNSSLANQNCRLSFEWLLAIWPPDGMSPSFNYQGWQAPFDIMTLGAFIFRDGRYRWAAERMLEHMVRNQVPKRGYWLGLESWDDSIAPIIPNLGSTLLEGPTGIANHLGPMKPDKIVLRGGWATDSSFALLNVRYSGWHSYKATNCIILFSAGAPFLVEGLPDYHYGWLPLGISDYRDQRVDRMFLNGLQLSPMGAEAILYETSGFGYQTSQAPPKFADIEIVTRFNDGWLSRSTLKQWNGWSHTRTLVLVDDVGLFVIDSASGSTIANAEITWHFKGQLSPISDGFLLFQNPYNLTVLYSSDSNGLETKLEEESLEYYGAEPIHSPDYLFVQSMSSSKSIGCVTFLIPNVDSDSVQLTHTDWSSSDDASITLVRGFIHVNGTDYFVVDNPIRETVTLGMIESDAAFTLVSNSTHKIHALLYKGTHLRIRTEHEPQYVLLNGEILSVDIDWSYSGGFVSLNTELTELAEITLGMDN